MRRKFFQEVGCSTSNEPFNFGADPEHDPHTGIFNIILPLKIFVRCVAPVQICADLTASSYTVTLMYCRLHSIIMEISTAKWCL